MEEDNDEFLMRRGYCFRVGREYEKALNDYNRAIKLSPKTHNYYSNRAELYYYLDQYSNALQDIQSAITLFGEGNGKYHYNKGMIHLKLDQNEEACSEFKYASTLESSAATRQIEIHCQ
ncbi:tetratricopeptide (TPR) repeat protein [Lewinella marina]|nr:tetratricopeptide (TPR) repeat protein [Neolewinella marina]